MPFDHLVDFYIEPSYHAGAICNQRYKETGCIYACGFSNCFCLLLCYQVLVKGYSILFAPKRWGFPTYTFQILIWMKVSDYKRISVLGELLILEPQSPNLEHKVQG